VTRLVIDIVNGKVKPDPYNQMFITLIPKIKILNLLRSLDPLAYAMRCTSYSPK